ncbi:hypothetical protein OS493_005991 [Desmophyllum pertusum]|uniref:Uncharacterized protein n=1 Tax=Desmophyllum pertusum TaxID=174260 RepID=A0A9W9YIT7_9CNID|nr:hypothetical protein OS493_005991 [Desmophyllum pertusum]
MKLLVLSLLVLTSVCFVLGAEEDSFDLDANEGELFDAPENFVEDEENYMEDDEDFEEDDDSNGTKLKVTKRPVVEVKPVETFPPVPPGEPEAGSGEPNQADIPDLKEKLGLNNVDTKK